MSIYGYEGSRRQAMDEAIKRKIKIGKAVRCKISYNDGPYRTSTLAKVRAERWDSEGLVRGFSGEILWIEDRTDSIQEGDQQFVAFEDVV